MGTLLIVLLLTLSAANAECIDSLWISSPGSTNSDQGTGLTLAEDGNVYVCGYFDYVGITQGNGWLAKVNPSTGDVIWSRQYSGGTQSIFTDIYPTPDGGLICGGWARHPPDNDQDFWFMRVNGNGDSLWSRSYGHEFYNQGVAVVASPDGGYAIAGRGHTLPGGIGNVDWWILKINANGDSVWSRVVGSPGEDTAYDMILTSDNQFLVGGRTILDSTGAGRLALIGETGNVIWDRLYEFAPSVDIYGLIETTEGFLACGAEQQWDEDGDVMIMETDLQGNLLWHRRFEFDITGVAIARSVLPDSLGGFYIVGHAQRVSTTEKDVFVLHVSNCGDSLGTRWIGSTIDEDAARAIVTSTNEIVTAGVAVHPGNQREILMFGLSADSCNIPPCSFVRVAPEDSTMPGFHIPVVFNWTRSSDAEESPIDYIFHLETDYSNDAVYPLDTVVTDTFVNVYIDAPLSRLDEPSNFRWRVWATDGQDTVETSNGEGFFQMEVSADADENTIIPSQFALTVFPNPFNPNTTLSFTLTKSSHVTLDLFDIQGRHVQSLASNVMSAGEHSVLVNGDALSSGIYFAKLQAGAQSSVAKLVLMR